MTHTPGPWNAGSIVNNSRPIYSDDARWCKTPLARVWGYAGMEEELHGNTALIAAAPDMLAVLDQIMERADAESVPFHILEQTVAALKKARGQ